jgi:hypothetical protein
VVRIRVRKKCREKGKKKITVRRNWRKSLEKEENYLTLIKDKKLDER